MQKSARIFSSGCLKKQTQWYEAGSRLKLLFQKKKNGKKLDEITHWNASLSKRKIIHFPNKESMPIHMKMKN